MAAVCSFDFNFFKVSFPRGFFSSASAESPSSPEDGFWVVTFFEGSFGILLVVLETGESEFVLGVVVFVFLGSFLVVRREVPEPSPSPDTELVVLDVVVFVTGLVVFVTVLVGSFGLLVVTSEFPELEELDGEVVTVGFTGGLQFVEEPLDEEPLDEEPLDEPLDEEPLQFVEPGLDLERRAPFWELILAGERFQDNSFSNYGLC